MLQPRWRKVLRDLWGNKVRTLLVVFSIAIGVFAIGVIVGTQVILSADLSNSYQATHPASAVLSSDGFDADFVEAMHNVEGVQQAEGRRNISLRVQVGAEEWKTMSVEVLDFEENHLNILAPEAGEWPPAEEVLVVERASLVMLNAEIGDVVTVETANGRFRQLPITGTLHDLNKPPAQFTGQPYGYITQETLEWLGFDPYFDELHILVAGDTSDKTYIQQVADGVKERVEKSGRTVYSVFIPEPGEHPLNSAIEPLLLILGVLGALSLFASSFLVINIINGLLAQHTKQIGVMKAIGARRGQIVHMYLITVTLFGLLSLLLAIPLGAVAAYGFTAFIASLLNLDLSGFRFSTEAMMVQTAVGILVPVVAALVPVIQGTAHTVREALSDYGLGKGQFGSSLFDRLLNWFTATVLHLSQPMRISLRNTIRRKARLIFTLFTLTLGGAIFIGILSVRMSLLATLDDALSYFNYDVEVGFNRPFRIEEILREAEKVPGVVQADSWVVNVGRRQRPDGTESGSIIVFGVAHDTEIIKPTLLNGRWLQADDENAIVINSLVLQDDPDIKVGDTLTLDIAARESEWLVVGIAQATMTGPFAYVNRPYFAREIRSVGRATGVQVIAISDDPAYQLDLANRLKAHFDSIGMQVTNTGTTGEIRETVTYQFDLIIIFLAIMAVLIAAVGGLGLMGTMSINVMERTREIGVMRAVGASDGSIVRIVLVEGIFVGIISWVLGALAAYPIGKLLSDMVGQAFIQSTLNYQFATNGAIGWLAAILIIASVASYLPAHNASRLSVRETLAYE